MGHNRRDKHRHTKLFPPGKRKKAGPISVRVCVASAIQHRLSYQRSATDLGDVNTYPIRPVLECGREERE